MKLLPSPVLLALLIGCNGSKFGLADPYTWDTGPETDETTDESTGSDDGDGGGNPGGGNPGGDGGTTDGGTTGSTDGGTTDGGTTDGGSTDGGTTDGGTTDGGTTDGGTTDGGPGGPGGGDDTGDECGVATPSHSGPNCVFDLIGCGGSVHATTARGSNILDAEFYESATCFIPDGDYAADERVYELILDGDGDPITATVTLDAPCGDLALSTFFWSDEDECPQGAKHNISTCTGSTASSGDDVVLYSTGEDPERYLIAVDGDAEAAFTLSVTCEN